MKKITAIVLCITLLLSCTQASLAIVDRNKIDKKKTDNKENHSVLDNTNDSLNLVTLGSSQTVGYGLPGFYPTQFSDYTGTEEEIADWNENGWKAKTWNPMYAPLMTDSNCGWNGAGIGVVVPGALPDLLKKELENDGYSVNLHQLCTCGFRANDFLLFLYDDYQLDAYGQYYMYMDNMLLSKYGDTQEESLSYLKNLYQTNLQNADVIIYDLGAGNFGNSLLSDFRNEDIDVCYKNILSAEDYLYFEKLRQIVEQQFAVLLNNNNIDSEIITSFADVIDRMTYSLLAYCTSLDKTMDWIFTHNPDAKVVVMQIQNLAKNMKFYFEGITLPAGDIINILISIANNYAASYSHYTDKYYYARITDNQTVSFIEDELLAYQSPEDLTPALIQACDCYWFGEYSTLVKSDFTAVYEAAGYTVHDDNYDKALTYQYDAYLKYLKYIISTDYANMNSNWDDWYNAAYINVAICKELMADVLTNFEMGKDSSDSVKKAIEKFESCDDSIKRVLRLVLDTGTAELRHPNYEGYKQMTDAVIKALDNEYTGCESIKKGIVYFIKDMSSTNASITEYVVEDISSKIKENVYTSVNAVKNCIDKVIANPLRTIVTKIKDFIQ